MGFHREAIKDLMPVTREKKYFRCRTTGLIRSIQKRKCPNCEQWFDSVDDFRYCRDCRRPLNDGRYDYKMIN
jgi:hypothetical protein